MVVFLALLLKAKYLGQVSFYYLFLYQLRTGGFS
jgi:hypothetical protein